MRRKNFWLDMVWLVVVGVVLVMGDYRRRDDRRERHDEFKAVRTTNELGSGRRTF